MRQRPLYAARSGKLTPALEARLGVPFGQTTADGKFTLGHVECLGACATAPMFMATEKATGRIRYFEELDTPEKVDEVITLIASGRGFDSTERWPRGPFHHGGRPDTNFLLANVDHPDSHTLDAYLAAGGYKPPARPSSGGKTPAQVIDEMKAANVRGRGGAGFSAGVKWSFIPAGVYPRYLVVNADESEPGTFKDRMIMEYDPHQLLEGILLACYAIEAELAFIYIRGEYYFAAQRLEGAIAEAEARGILGDRVFGTVKKLKVVVHRGRGRVRVRRRNRTTDLARGRPWPSAAQAALPRGRRPVRQADHRQQRRDDQQRAPRARTRCGLVPAVGSSQQHRLPYLRHQRPGEEPRPLRAAARRHPPRADLRLGRRADR